MNPSHSGLIPIPPMSNASELSLLIDVRVDDIKRLKVVLRKKKNRLVGKLLFRLTDELF